LQRPRLVSLSFGGGGGRVANSDNAAHEYLEFLYSLSACHEYFKKNKSIARSTTF
jgi:hypothetical protein